MQITTTPSGSFDACASSFTSNGQQTPQHLMFNNPNTSNGMMAPSGSFRSFSEANGFNPAQHGGPAQIYTAVYSGVSVYELEVNGIAVMRRRSDSWLNATQILKVAGVDKGKRTKVLEKEILTGNHEKVQGGYGKYQGTWIDYKRGREFCRQYGVEELLRPLLEYDVSADGSGAPGQGMDTPTKEQAMAANRKRFYTTSMEARAPAQNSDGTFFSNISSTASNALAAMNKVARMNSPTPRPGSSQRRPGTIGGRPSQPPMASQESFRSSQQSMQSIHSEKSFGATGQGDSTYGTSSALYGADGMETQEPPRKRMRSDHGDSFAQSNGGRDVAMRDGSPTEPNESFTGQMSLPQVPPVEGEAPTALPPLPPPKNKMTDEKQAYLTDLFADTSRTDFADHPALRHLSGAELDLPIDNAANTAMHWAATLARVSLMRLLVSKGANMFRGNAAGQTPLMSAVSVNNSLDHSCFPETLEILSPLIEFRDHQGRTILHHIAVTCAIKGRASSSKYYLEALLEFLVRSNSANGQQASFDVGSSNKPIGLMRFMGEMVNARDKSGNTALNLAARIGNRSIIRQLLEVQADVTIPNYKGMRPIEFGVGVDVDKSGYSQSQAGSPPKGKAPLSRSEETSREIMPLFNSFLSQAETQYSAETRIKQDQIDKTNSMIKELSTHQKLESQKLDVLRQRNQVRSDRLQRIQNLRRWAESQRRALANKEPAALTRLKACSIGDADLDTGVAVRADHLPDSVLSLTTILPSSTAPEFTSSINGNLDIDTLSGPHQAFLYSLPPVHVLKARLSAYISNNSNLQERCKSLKERNGELEAQYRKIISICTNTDETRIEESLSGLVAAVESETSDGIDVSRVKEFLRKVEGVDP
ncbi:start control protein cdc10 [Pseudovirgaria hyperparasitica]|uniref:Transcription factor SWI6 n=1 Tax=Pseudovirgaria hyperparasitica TaxID=470096 RepID=A0A6A6WH58_9PEZI|nr:start control protein cdc10 [Pseudovirgaria hyperparasitica]KAF2762142.1 start control protein cdc10 [Pseudovirgaria hyperparasitica]